MLTGQSSPYTGFGEPTNSSIIINENYSKTTKEAFFRISELFKVQCNLGIESIKHVDEVITEMWSSGWDPDKANVNLFATDFGCVVTEGLKLDLGGALVLRSETDLNHASLWWKEQKIEAFPFHSTYKRLKFSENQSLLQFAQSLRKILLAK